MPMKKIPKIISRIILLTAISIISILFGLYIWLTQRIDNVIDKETYNHLVEEIKASEDLPERFYEIYEQVTGFNEKSTTNKLLFYRLIQEKRNSCPCVDASYDFGHISIDSWTVGLALDKDASPKKCLDFSLSKYDFLYHAIGIQHASQFYYRKDIKQLSDDEMFELSVMTLNPSYYNKIRRPEELKKEVERIKNEQE